MSTLHNALYLNIFDAVANFEHQSLYILNHPYYVIINSEVA